MCVFLLLLLFSPPSSAVRVLSESLLRCPRQDLNCTASETNCMDSGILKAHPYTPAGPESLQVSVDSREDETGRLQPVLKAQWVIKDEGSIRYLEATELHVLVLSTNQNLCVRYAFRHTLPMRTPSGEKWSFSADMLVVDPGLTYKVSVFNIPRPELRHTTYDVSRVVTAPDCDDPRMQPTQFCIDRGSLWRPNITLDVVDGGSALFVSFLSDPLCEEYVTIVSCQLVQETAFVSKDGRTALNSTFRLDRWPRSCCQFRVEINPLFPQCGQDCRRVATTSHICPEKPPDGPDVRPYAFVVMGVVFTCVLVAAAVCVLCRKWGPPGVGPGEKPPPPLLLPPQPRQTPKVLVIYSQDHRLYRDVVLKLCAFLQAKCGTKVLVDLLDSASIGMVGRLRWLENQRQQLRNPSDKILVLCSRGVQAKWRAMCGQQRVTLREDVLSPTDDMLTPFLNLFLPKMHHAGTLGRYMVAYFEDISGEQDVPSIFDIAVKYSLMKHFEELFFGILDLEKYQPGQVNHIEGIGGEEYSSCPSGRALKLAIETFRAHQLEHPDWFERECVHSEEELLSSVALPHCPAVLECVPLIRDGPPLSRHEVELRPASENIYVIAPELNPHTVSVAQVAPVVRPECDPERPAALLQVLTDPQCVHDSGREPVYFTEPVLNGTFPRQNSSCLSAAAFGPVPTEQDEEDALLPGPAHQEWLAFPDSMDSSVSQSSHDGFSPPSDVVFPQPVETEECRGVEPAVKGSSSGSDQGYSSKTSSTPEVALKEDPLAALARLQEELFQQSLRS